VGDSSALYTFEQKMPVNPAIVIIVNASRGMLGNQGDKGVSVFMPRRSRSA